MPYTFLCQMLTNYDATLRRQRKKKKKKQLVVVAVILFLRQQSSVPAAGKVLLQTAIGLWVGVFL